MTNHKVGTLICGATMTGLGAAERLPGRVLMVEAGFFAAPEYIDCFRLPGDLRATPPGAEELKAELAARNILSEEGLIHLPAVAPVYFGRLASSGAESLFGTRVVGVSVAEGGFTVELYNASGFSAVFAERILDTTAGRETMPSGASELIDAKSLGAALFYENGARLPEGEGVGLARGPLPGEAYLRFPLAPRDGWIDARRKLLDYWVCRPESLRQFKIAVTASTFDIRLKSAGETLSLGWEWMPSCAFGNLLDAYGAGEALAREWL